MIQHLFILIAVSLVAGSVPVQAADRSDLYVMDASPTEIREISTDSGTSIDAGTEAEAVHPQVDDHLYLSDQVEGKDINDVYAILLSIRNVLLVFFLSWAVLRLRQIIHNAIKRIYGG